MDTPNIEQWITQLAGQFPWIMAALTILGSLVVVGQGIVLITPSKRDDEILDQIEKNTIGGYLINFLTKFAVFQKK